MASERLQQEWQDWLAEFGPRLLLFARQQARHRYDAEDLLQEACARAWRRHARNGGGVPHPRFFFQAIRRVAVDWARSEDRRHLREDRYGRHGPMHDDFECPLEADERRRELESAVRRLPLHQQEVLVLKIWGGLTFAEIAETLGISANTAASRYRYALDHLRNDLATPVS